MSMSIDMVSELTTRILASTGTNSQAPIFNIGLFLPSGVKLSEGFGSSYKMAEHRAAVNALLSMFLVCADTTTTTKSALPTSIHPEWLLQAGKVVAGQETFTPSGRVEVESIVESKRLRN
jgi:large subunit ribosomal protein L44